VIPTVHPGWVREVRKSASSGSWRISPRREDSCSDLPRALGDGLLWAPSDHPYSVGLTPLAPPTLPCWFCRPSRMWCECLPAQQNDFRLPGLIAAPRTHELRAEGAHGAEWPDRSLSISFAHVWQSQIALPEEARSLGDSAGSYRGPSGEAAVTCAATPTFTVPDGPVCGPLVGWRHLGLEQRNATLLASSSLTPDGKSSLTRSSYVGLGRSRGLRARASARSCWRYPGLRGRSRSRDRATMLGAR